MKGFQTVVVAVATFTTVLFEFSFIGQVSGIHITPYEDFCQAELIYRPYIKYYKGRIGAMGTGLPYVTHSPGFWTDIRENDMRNVYLCINGPAWLYYKITTGTTEVYEAPDLKLFVHHCFIANGLPGPGPHYMEKTLEAILLIGDQYDYRHPSIQLFTAPWQDPADPTSPIINATSLMMIGDNTECILSKGEENTQIRIRTALTTDAPKTRKEQEKFNKNWAGSYCKLAYQDLVDPAQDPVEGPAPSVGNSTGGGGGPPLDAACSKTGLLPNNVTNVCECVQHAPDPSPAGECKKCASATQVATDGLKCSDCVAPKFVDDLVCKDCSLPFYMDSTGACKECTGGKFVDTTAKDCKDCLPNSKVDSATWTECKCDATFIVDPATPPVGGLVTCIADPAPPGRRKKRQAGLEIEADDLVEEEVRSTAFWAPDHAVSKRWSPFELFQEVDEGEALIRRERAVNPGAKEIAAQMLLHDKVIRIQGCYLPQMATAKTQDIVTKRQVQIDGLKDFVDKLKMTDYLTKKGLKDTEMPEEVTDPTKLDPHGVKKELDDQYKELSKLSKKDPGYVDAKTKIEDVIKPIKRRIAGHEAFQQEFHLNEVYKDATEKWKGLDTNTTLFVGTTAKALQPLNETMLNSKNAWDAAQTESDEATTKAAYLAAKEAYDVQVDIVDTAFKQLAADISEAESARLQVDAAMRSAKAAYDEFYRVVKQAEKGGDVDLMTYPKFPVQPTLIVIKKLPRDELDEKPSIEANKSCGALPKPKSACASKKPLQQRSCELFKARMDQFKDAEAKERTWKDPEDTWRQQVLELVEDLFFGACGPMVKRDYAIGISRIIKAYLIEFVEGTLPLTFQKDPEDPTKPETEKPMLLPAKRPFWDHIISALQDCKGRRFKMQFVKRIGVEREHIYKFVKVNPNNTREEIVVEHLVEQADEEYAFNWAIDSHWRMFATVMGVCMPAYETKIPLITSKFYTHYTEDFFSPLNRTWVDNRDNAVFQKIFGEYYNKRDEIWSKNCMEASFLFSDDRNYRPPRKLLVNRVTEANFFRTGPQAGTYGMYETS